MTTAARPTFDTAKGKEEHEFSYLTSAKDLPSHTKLKTRRPGQGGEDEQTVEELRLELEAAEKRHFASKALGSSLSTTQSDPQRLADEKTRYIEMAQRLDAESDASDASDADASSGSESGSASSAEDDESEDESEDETAMLMRELEKIKRERAEEKAREEQEDMERRLMDGGPSAGGNPLLAKQDFSVRRRWDDDVVFRNQARGDDDRPKKRFVNDMLRSDFHRKFMRKYVQ
ncbi:complexed with cef1p [Coemansia sp. RSA 2611]|nr:complexed with cef1p [Coemansia sp. RSA 2610]KAJ2389714.1 complexed with cef1p [Coemansia sp. RSA 2611]